MLVYESSSKEQVYDYLETFINILDGSNIDTKLIEWVSSDDNLSQDPTADVPNFRILTDVCTVDVYYRQDDADEEYYLEFSLDGELYSGFGCPLDCFSACLTAAEQVANMIDNALS
jgi:hypothetical protein